MKPPPVWIAGVGAVSAAGADVQSTLVDFENGRRNLTAALPFKSPVTCPTFQVSAALPALPGRMNSSRTLRLTMQAVNEALADAGIKQFPPGARVGICLGTTVACQLTYIPFYASYRKQGNPGFEPIHEFLETNLPQAMGDMLGVAGPRMTVVNACSSGTDAIGIAADWIRAGLCDFAIAGGADEIYRVPVAGFWSLGVMSSQPCAPFDRDRAGLNLGEGAGILLLESESQAQKREKKHACQVAGFGAACDAHHLTAPHPEGRGIDAAIRTALSQAAIAPEQIAFINAHGTATLDNDVTEGKVISRIFGQNVPFLSTKGYTGHTLGAAGGLEAVFTLLGLRERWIPLSAGFENKADDIPVVPVQQRTTISGEFALSTSLAFGGNNSALVIRRTAS